MDGGAWWAAVHGVSKSRTRLSDFTFTFHFHALEKEMEVLTRKNSSLGGFSQNTQTSPRPRLLLSNSLSVWGCRRATQFTPPPWGVGMEVGEVEL